MDPLYNIWQSRPDGKETPMARIKQKPDLFKYPWLIVGDFNATLRPDEVSEPGRMDQGRIEDFQ